MKTSIIILIIITIIISWFIFNEGTKEFPKGALSIAPVLVDVKTTDDSDSDKIPNWLEEILGTEKNTFDDIDLLKQDLISEDVSVLNSDSSPNSFYREIIATAGTQLHTANKDGEITEDELESIYQVINEKLSNLPLDDYSPEIKIIQNAPKNIEQFIIDLDGIIGYGFNVISQEKDYTNHAIILRAIVDEVAKINTPQIIEDKFLNLLKQLEFIARLEEETPGAFATDNAILLLSLTYTYRYINEIKETLTTMLP